MASVPLQPPHPFNFRNPDDWPKWKRRFEQYRLASGLSGESDARQVSTLLYCLGEEAEDVLTSANASEEDRKKLDTVVQKLDDFFQVRKNVIFETARFNRRNQREGESAEEYITCLYNLVENCEYGDLKSEMIRDRLVVGIRDSSLSERLQTEAAFTLEKEKTVIRQREAVQEQQLILSHGENVDQRSAINYVKGKPFWRHGTAPHRPPASRPFQQASTASQRHSSKCKRCGKGPHPRQQCPAKDAVCYNCRKKGHYSGQCLSKSSKEATKVSEIITTEYPSVAYLSTIGAREETSWLTTVAVNSEPMKFKVDTGAEVTALTEEGLSQLGTIQLKSPSKVLCGPDRTPLKVLGQTRDTLTSKGKSCSQDVYVVQHLKHNLLGLPAIRALGLLSQADEIMVEPKEIHSKFPSLFTGLGTFEGDFEIHLRPDAQPFALHTPRNVPLPLRKKVKDELKRMESLGVISKVDTPTSWCAGMVVVPKQDGTVRICVDLKPLNAHVLRETHPLPKVDDVLAQLAGAKIFSKLDANSGFWQIPLAESSRLLTTFITPFGRFCFNKMPFGISSAPEHFQRRMSEILEGLPGVVCLMDDILIYGKDKKQHGINLATALNRIQSAKVTLNKEKCEFGKTSIRFLGHIINGEGVSADPRKTAAIQEMRTPQSIPELRRFLGMVNQLGKFSPVMAELTKPLRELLSKKSTWLWGPSQDEAFQKIKSELASPPVLTWYDPTAETRIAADASSYGLGAVLLQKQRGEWKPAAYASRSLTETETRYAQIEKEALATTWACERFSNYILGKSVSIETDHKPSFLYSTPSISTACHLVYYDSVSGWPQPSRGY